MLILRFTRNLYDNEENLQKIKREKGKMDIENAYKVYSGSNMFPHNVGRIACIQRNQCSLESTDGIFYASCSKKAMEDTAPAVGDWCVFEKMAVH